MLDSLKIIGIHKGYSINNNSFNLGTLLKYPLIEFNSNKNEIINNEIIINLKIDEDDLNKDIYIK